MINNRNYYHNIYTNPIPSDKNPIYVNEPWLIDDALLEIQIDKQPKEQPDSVLVYLPMDLSKSSILRRLNNVIAKYGPCSEKNESWYAVEVGQIASQLEIYDQVWCERHKLQSGEHSTEAVELARDFVETLESIPDYCSEIFPFDLIAELKMEYLGIAEEF